MSKKIIPAGFKSLKDKHLNFEILEEQLNSSFKSLSNFYKNMENLPIRPDVKPGFIYDKFIKEIPQEPVSFDTVLKEFEKDIFPNTCLWQHPKFFAYYGAPVSHTAITLETISSAMNNPNFNWNVSPAAHELEWVVMDWMVKLLGLGEKFTFDKGGCGGAVNSTTEAIFLSVVCAKYKKIKELELSQFDPRRLKFVGYYPYTNKDWAEKALGIKDITVKRCMNVYYNEDTGNYNINPEELRSTIKADIEEGLVPCWYGGQLGATYCGSSCQLDIIGPILKEFNIYFNLDAAHAGLFSMIPELRPKGIEYANNICVNMAKSGMGIMAASTMFNDDKESLINSLGAIDGEIYRTEKSGIKINYNNYTVGFGRRMQGLKFYGLLKTIGVSGYQEYLRNIIERGEYFLSLMKTNPRFELFARPAYGLVSFRFKPLKGDSLEDYNEFIIKLQNLMDLNSEDGIVSSASVNGIKFLRFVSANTNTEKIHVDMIHEKFEKNLELI